jgi:probable F420-dependent oxidoreductase
VAPRAAATIRPVKPAIILPTMPRGANPEGILAAAETAQRLGWQTAWTTDHVLVPGAAAADYGGIYDVIVTLGWVGAQLPRLRLGTSVIVVPMRNAVVLAKELATLDSLLGGRLVVGVGVGWNRTEFGNVGVEERFHRRGAYLDEAIAIWRHLWSGSTEPFAGQFHGFSDFVFGPLPAQGARLPIVVGGRSDAAVRRAARMGDGYHASSLSPAVLADRVAHLGMQLAEAGRGAIPVSARVSVRFGERPPSGYAVTGTPDEMLAELRAFADLGVEELAFAFGETDAERTRDAIERFDREVLSALR